MASLGPPDSPSLFHLEALALAVHSSWGALSQTALLLVPACLSGFGSHVTSLQKPSLMTQMCPYKVSLTVSFCFVFFIKLVHYLIHLFIYKFAFTMM